MSKKLELVCEISVSELEGLHGCYLKPYVEIIGEFNDLDDYLLEYKGKKIKITIEELED